MSKEKSKEKTQYSLKFERDSDEPVRAFADNQDNFNDSIRFLIEMMIALNGKNDLSEIIPSKRSSSFDFVRFLKGLDVSIEEKIKVLASAEIKISSSEPAAKEVPLENKDKNLENVEIPTCYEDFE